MRAIQTVRAELDAARGRRDAIKADLDRLFAVGAEGDPGREERSGNLAKGLDKANHEIECLEDEVRDAIGELATNPGATERLEFGRTEPDSRIVEGADPRVRGVRDQALRANERATFLSDDSRAHMERTIRADDDPEVLLARFTKLLFCQRCPVRRECLLAGLAPPPVPAVIVSNADGTTKLVESSPIPRSFLVWGGTFERERVLTEGLAVHERAALLEATFTERVEHRLTAWRAGLLERVAAPASRVSRFDQRVAAMLGEPVPERVTATALRQAARCRRCDVRLGWRKRADARYCSAACRQATYRRRVA